MLDNEKEESRTNSNFVIAAEFQILKLLVDLEVEKTSEAVPALFPHETARAIREAILLLKENGERVTEGSLLREANRISDKVDVGTIRTVLEYDADSTNWNGAIVALREGSVKYNLQLSLEKLLSKTQTADTLDTVEASNLLYEAGEILAHGGKKTRVQTLEECLDEYEETLRDRRDGKIYPFGDLFLDKALTRKAAPGQIITIVGTTGMGKSGLALNLINTAINLGTPCIYFSLEMDGTATMDRLLAMRTGIPIQDWYDPKNINSLLKRTAKEREFLKDKPFLFVDDPSVSLDVQRAIIRDFKLQHRVNYVLVFVDLVTQVPDFTSLKLGGTLANTIELGVNKQSAISKLENVCYVNVAQLNRETDGAKISSIEDIESFRPSLTQIKNSNAIGERSRTVLSVFRPKYYADRLFPNHPALISMEDILEIQIIKQTQGPAGLIGKSLFEGETMSLKTYIEIEGDTPEDRDGEE